MPPFAEIDRVTSFPRIIFVLVGCLLIIGGSATYVKKERGRERGLYYKVRTITERYQSGLQYVAEIKARDMQTQ